MKETEPRHEQERQITDTVVMISPDTFGFNPETANSNSFQKHLNDSPESIRSMAVLEFNSMVNILKNCGINVLVIPSRENVITPDAVFPNNWFSHHQDGSLVVYPMLAPNRRKEKQIDNLVSCLNEVGMEVKTKDMSFFESEGKALEGTGSLVLDRANKTAFAIESPRTSKEVFDYWCKNMGYHGVLFHAYDEEDKPIYHTNVIMGIGEKFTVISLESIKNGSERLLVEKKLTLSGREIVPVTLDQVSSYCGNVLQLKSTKGDPVIVMSKTSFDAFDARQQTTLAKYGNIPFINIKTIETIGGGSARCMVAEIMRSKKT